MKVSWNDVANETGYDIKLVQAPWRWEDIKYSASVGANTTSYTFNNVAVGEYQAFVISRPNADNVQSGWTKFAILPEYKAPTVSATVSGKTVDVTWNDTDANSYYLYVENKATGEQPFSQNLGKALSCHLELAAADWRVYVSAVYAGNVTKSGYADFTIVNPEPTVSFSPWEKAGSTYVGDTDASIGQHVSVSNGDCTDVGMKLYNKNGSELAGAHNGPFNYVGSYNYDVYFKINEECGYTLAPATQYQYKFYTIVNGKTYWSSASSFTTGGVTVSYDANGGMGAPAAQTGATGAVITLSSAKPTREGYSFKGWATSKTATSAQYQPGGKYTASASATLYAVWEKNTYSVTYDANGGTGAPAAQTKTYGTDLTLSNTKPARNGYVFKGWTTDRMITDAQYQPGGKYTANAAATLYALWEEYKVKLDGVIYKFDASADAFITSGYTDALPADVVIRAEVEGKPVTGVMELAFEQCSQIRTLTVPVSVSHIGAYAFAGCENLDQITFAHTSTNALTIGVKAFELPQFDIIMTTPTETTVTLPDKDNIPSAVSGYDWAGSHRSVKYVYLNSAYPADGESGIFRYTYDETLGGMVITGLTVDIYYEGVIQIPAMIEGYPVVAIGGYAMAERSLVTSISIPDSVKSIGEGAFMNCAGITSVTLPDGLEQLGGRAFSYCSSLKSIEIPGTVGEVNGQFWMCTDLERVVIHEGVTEIGSFQTCNKLKEIIIPEGVTRIAMEAFSGTSLDHIALPSTIQTIGIGAFYNCSNLKEVTIPAAVSKIEQGAFAGDPDLIAITFEHDANSALAIGEQAFDLMDQGTQTVATTVCVPDTDNINPAIVNYAWSYAPRSVSFGSAATPAATMESRSLYLKGNVGLNFFVTLPQGWATDGDAHAEINGTRMAYPAMNETTKEYQFTYYLTAKEMRDDVVLKLYDRDGKPFPIMEKDGGEPTQSYTFSAQAYFDLAHEKSSDESLLTMLDRMSEYGMYAQLYFQHNTAAAVVSAEMQGRLGGVGEASLSVFEPTISEKDSAPISYTGASLTLKSETRLRHFFALGAGEIGDYVFTVNGVEVTPVAVGAEWAVEIEHIAAKDLDTPYTVKVTKSGEELISVSRYSALSYALRVIRANGNGDAGLVDLMKGLYLYNAAANNYFDNR